MATKTNSLEIPSRYKLKSAAGEGGFGTVSVYTDQFLRRDVAIKTVKSPDGREQLENEILRLSDVRSKHVVEIYDVVWDKTGKAAGMIMELVPGEPLTQYHAKPHKPADYLFVVYQMARGIADLHDKGVVHRDIKLDNMKRTTEGVVKLFDFGLASDDGQHVTMTSRGTLVYRAPELYKPPKVISTPVDTYAFGICCWALATHTLPAVLYERPPQTSGPPPSIGSQLPKLPKALRETIDACLAVDPDDRPSMEDVATTAERELLRDSHSALLIWNWNPYVLNASRREVPISVKEVGSAKVIYDGLGFWLTEVEGEIYVNNELIARRAALPGACVITIGAPWRERERDFIEVDISHPEVVI